MVNIGSLENKLSGAGAIGEHDKGTRTASALGSDETIHLQTVTIGLTPSHRECTGWYQDFTGTYLIKCSCRCHQLTNGQQRTKQVESER